MKRSYLLAMALLVATGSCAVASTGHNILVTPKLDAPLVMDDTASTQVVNDLIQKAFGKTDDSAVIAQSKAFVGNINDADKAAKIEFGPTVFDADSSTLFLGAVSPNAGAASVVSAALRKVGKYHYEVEIRGLTPQKIVLNGQRDAENPLFSTQIRELKLGGFPGRRSLLVTRDDGQGVVENQETELFEIIDLQSGSGVRKTERADNAEPNGQFLRDADGLAIAHAPVAFAAGRDGRGLDGIFAAVRDGRGQTWRTDNANDGQYRGIAPLVRDGERWVMGNFADQAASPARAFKLNLQAIDDDAALLVRENFPVAFRRGTENAIDDLVAGDLQTASLLGDNVAMYHSDRLGVTYVGLQGVTRGEEVDAGIVPNHNQRGGVISLLVTGVNQNNNMFVRPVAHNPTADMFDERFAGQQIVGFHRDTRDGDGKPENHFVATVNNVRTMHTSTGRDYVIVNGGVVSDEVLTSRLGAWVFALPVMPRVDRAGNPVANVGQLAAVEPETGVAAIDQDRNFALVQVATSLINVDRSHVAPNILPLEDADALPLTQTELPAVVGAGPQMMTFNGQTQEIISDMQVVGDSVFVSLASERGTIQSGIFCSTALFNEDGLIYAWTPWQRVGGAVDLVKGFGPDKATGGFVSLVTEHGKAFDSVTGDELSFNRIKATAWGKSGSVSRELQTDDGSLVTSPTNNLTAILEKHFPAEKGGVTKIELFDEFTPGFQLGGFSMMVVIGHDTIALIETMRDLIPTQEYFDEGERQNVFLFRGEDHQELRRIAPLSSAEVLRFSHIDAQDSDQFAGHLYVGGFGGVVRMQSGLNDGWNSTDGLNRLRGVSADPENFPGAFGFVPLNPGFTPVFAKTSEEDRPAPVENVHDVISMSSDGEFVHILTPNELVSVNQVTDRVGNDVRRRQLDGLGNAMVLAGQTAIIGTTSGLWLFDTRSGESVRVSGLDYNIRSLSFVKTEKGRHAEQGNLFVLASHFGDDSGKLFSFNVNANRALQDRVLPILPVRPVTPDAPAQLRVLSDMNRYRSGVSSLCNGLFTSLARDKEENTDVLNMRSMTQDLDRQPEQYLSLLLDSGDQDIEVTAPVLNSATGIPMVALGDQGVRVNS